MTGEVRGDQPPERGANPDQALRQLRVREAAELLGFAEHSLFDMIRRGLLDGCVVRYGRNLRLLEAELLAWARSGGRPA